MTRYRIEIWFDADIAEALDCLAATTQTMEDYYSNVEVVMTPFDTTT